MFSTVFKLFHCVLRIRRSFFFTGGAPSRAAATGTSGEEKRAAAGGLTGGRLPPCSIRGVWGAERPPGMREITTHLADAPSRAETAVLGVAGARQTGIRRIRCDTRAARMYEAEARG